MTRIGPMVRELAVGFYRVTGAWPLSLTLQLRGEAVPGDIEQEAKAARLFFLKEKSRVDAMGAVEWREHVAEVSRG